MEQIELDKQLISKLGGPAKVAQLLGFEGYGAQRVNNWVTRGIPARIKLAFPKIFLRKPAKQKEVA